MVRCRPLLVVTVGVAIAVSLSCGPNQPAPSIAASVDSLMSELYDQGYFNGAVVVGRGDQVLYERGFGLANVEEGLPFTPDTPSHGASMAKTLTAAAILILEEDGRIDLDDPVTTQLPEFPYPEVTIRHLISHDSGLHPEAVYFNTFAPQADKRTNDRLLEILAEHKPPLAFPPGSAFEYSSTGYIMAALLIERATGQSYAAFLRERIFDPLQMNSSFVRPAEDSDWNARGRSAIVVSRTVRWSSSISLSTGRSTVKEDSTTPRTTSTAGSCPSIRIRCWVRRRSGPGSNHRSSEASTDPPSLS